MSKAKRNIFVRFILRAVDVFAAFYLGRPVRWNEEPFRRASPSEKRMGAFFMVLFPAGMMAVALPMHSVDYWIDSMTTGRHSIVWLYVTVIKAIVGFGAFVLFLSRPKCQCL